MEKNYQVNTEKLLEMSLDDISKMNSKTNKQDKNNNNRRKPFYRNKPQNKRYNSNYNYDKKYTYNKDVKAKKFSNKKYFNKFDVPNTKTRLIITNLHKGVNNQELKGIFEKIGPLKRCGVHWDKVGNSTGVADVEYVNPKDAKEAVEYFNKAEIEGIFMKVQYNDRDNSKNYEHHNFHKSDTATNHKRLFRHRLKYKI